MGVQFKDLVVGKEVDFDYLKGKVLAVDTSNMLYQFLTSIRSRDGSLLMDSKGEATSHLQGLLSRVSNLLVKDIKLCFVLDGKPPELKKEERERRKELKQEAEKKYKIAEQRKDLEEMRKYAARTVRLTKEIVEESVKLIEAFGLPVVQAPSEADSQAAFLVKKGDSFAVASQDFDSLIHGSPKVIRNLSISGRKKKAGALSYSTVKPELIVLSDCLNELGIDNNQLIALAMLIGTDYNIGGIKGIGPVNALKLVKKHKSDFDSLFKEVKWSDSFDFGWEEVYNTIKKMPVEKNYKLKWSPVDQERIVKLLCDEHDFSEERVNKAIEKLVKKSNKKHQKGLADFM